MDKTLRVGFFHHYAVGDNVRILKPLFLLKYIYNAKVIVFGNALMCEMTKNLPFVDACINIGELEFSHIPLINAQNLDYAILSNARTKYVKILDSTNIKHFFTRLKLNSLFAKKSKTIFVKLPKYRHLNGVDIMCEYVKKINPKLAAKKLAQISTDEIDNSSKLITSYENKQNITKFFYLLGNNIMAKNGGGGG